MSFETDYVTNTVPVTVITTHGDIDASNYQSLVLLVQTLVKEGTRDLLLDLGDTGFISSSGLVALHSITMILNGGQPMDVENGWAALREMAQGPGTRQEHIKLLNVQPRVDRTLDISGLKSYYEIYTDRAEALASFQPERTSPSAS